MWLLVRWFDCKCFFLYFLKWNPRGRVTDWSLSWTKTCFTVWREEKKTSFSVRIFLLVSPVNLKARVFLRDLGGRGGFRVSNPVVNLSVWWWCWRWRGVSVQGTPVQHVKSSIDRCPIRASGCHRSCILMSCSLRLTGDQLWTNSLHRSITSAHALTDRRGVSYWQVGSGLLMDLFKYLRY